MATGTRSRRFGRSRSRHRVALAGAGYIAVVHAMSADAAAMKVHAVASEGGSSARHLAGELDARRCRPSELPAGADVMIVATPPEHHVALAIQGLAAGAAVLVEKPIATTLADADRLVAAASAPSAPVLRCAENLLHAPAWREVVRRRPALGTLSHLSVRTLQPPPDWGHFGRPMTNGGVLFDLGPHPVALALGAADEPVVAVSAELSSTREDGADDDAAVELRFASGLVATVLVSWTADEVAWDLQAASDTGVLRLELLPEVLLEHDGEPVALPTRHEVPDPRLEQLGYVDQLLDLVEGSDTGQTAAQGREVLEVICAAYASAAAGGDEVSLPFAGPRDATPMQLWRG
jgi:predicted dehydrogenase